MGFFNIFDITTADVVGNHKMDAAGNIDASDNTSSVNLSNLDMLHGGGLGEQPLSPHNAWVSCDNCHKWRRIPAALADQIDATNCTWYTIFFSFHIVIISI